MKREKRKFTRQRGKRKKEFSDRPLSLSPCPSRCLRVHGMHEHVPRNLKSLYGGYKLITCLTSPAGAFCLAKSFSFFLFSFSFSSAFFFPSFLNFDRFVFSLFARESVYAWMCMCVCVSFCRVNYRILSKSICKILAAFSVLICVLKIYIV